MVILMPDENATETEKKRFDELLKIETERISKGKESEHLARIKEAEDQFTVAYKDFSKAQKVFNELKSDASFMARRDAELAEILASEQNQTDSNELVKTTHDKVMMGTGLVEKREVIRYGRKEWVWIPHAGPIKVVEDLIGLKDIETEPLCSGHRRGRKFSRPAENEGWAVWQTVVGIAETITENHPDYLLAKQNATKAENNRYEVRNKYCYDEKSATNKYSDAENGLHRTERTLQYKTSAKDTIRVTVESESVMLATTIVEGIMSKEKAKVDTKYKEHLEKEKRLRSAKRHLMDLVGLRKTVNWSDVLTQSRYVEKSKPVINDTKPTEDKVKDRTDVVVEQVQPNQNGDIP